MGRSLPQVLAAALQSGPFDVIVREKDLPAVERARLVVDVAELARPHGSRVLVASDAALAHRVGADGVHLASRDPFPAGYLGLVGRSCHDAAELSAARAEGAGYVTLSPVGASASKPSYGPPLGMSGLGEMITSSGTFPVLALGGVDAELVGGCLAAGAAGVAVMGAIMGADDPGQVIAEIRAALDAPLPHPAAHSETRSA